MIRHLLPEKRSIIDLEGGVSKIHNFFRAIYDYCYPELVIWEVMEIDHIYMRFTMSDHSNFTVVITEKEWSNMTEIAKHLMLIGLTHRILDNVKD